MSLITSLNHAKQLEEYEAMAGVARSIVHVDTAKDLANYLKVSASLMQAIINAPKGRLVIYDTKGRHFVTRDPNEGAFEPRDKDAEALRCKMIAGLVAKHFPFLDGTPEHFDSFAALLLERIEEMERHAPLAPSIVEARS